MNKIFLNYLLKNFFKTFLIFVLVFYCFGVILNLFEEIEFFKNMDVSIFIPLMLTSIFIPSLIIKILPFIIFLSSMWFMITIRNNRDLLTLKVFGFSNLKIFLILAIASFFTGFAKGGAVAKGQPVIVGERGAEVFVPNQTGQITQAARGTGGGMTTVNFNINTLDASGFDDLLV